MRSGLLKTQQLPTELLNRFQANVKAAVETLAADHDLLSVPVTALAVTGAVAAGKSVVFYAGAPGAVLTLPLASAQGASVAAIVLVGNASTGAVTLQASGTDTINGGKSLAQAAGTVLLLTSDGVSQWMAIVGASATSTSITYNVFTTTVNGLVPAPGPGPSGRYLRDDGTWDVPTEDLEERWLRLLADYVMTLDRVPPGLEDDVQRALGLV